MRSFLEVDYNEESQDTYKGLILTYDNGKKIFNSGDPLIDWYDYCKFVYNGGAFSLGITSCGHSSNVGHWFMDGDKYIEKYFDSNTKQFITNDELDKIPMSQWDSKFLKCVITKDMKDFNDLKEYYQLNKK